MKKSILFITLLSVAFCASAQKEDNFQFGGFANVNRCGIITSPNNLSATSNPIGGLVSNSLPTIGYQFGFLTQYAFSELSKLQFGIGMAQTGSTTGTFSINNDPTSLASFESQIIHQDVMLPILYKRNFGKKSNFYVIGGITPLFKMNRNFKSIITLADGTQRVTSTQNSFESTRNLNLNPSLGIGYEMKVFKNNYLFLQPNFDINGFQLLDVFGNKRFYTLGLTVGVLSK
jgi:hypothetical protein